MSLIQQKLVLCIKRTKRPNAGALGDRGGLSDLRPLCWGPRNISRLPYAFHWKGAISGVGGITWPVEGRTYKVDRLLLSVINLSQ